MQTPIQFCGEGNSLPSKPGSARRPTEGRAVIPDLIGRVIGAGSVRPLRTCGRLKYLLLPQMLPLLGCGLAFPG
jgi:hypothetical protein